MLELFITSSERNSGKNYVTAGLAATMQSLGYSTGVYKPVECGVAEKNGFIQSVDLSYVKFIDSNVKTYFSYLLKSKGSPVVAAAKENSVIDKEIILKDYQNLSDLNDCLITCGSDGLAIPYGKDFLEEDLSKYFNIPLLIVVSPKISSINNIILTINYAEAAGLNLRGVIINDYPSDNSDLNIKLMPGLIEEYSNTKVMGILPECENPKAVNPNDLIENILNGVDLEGIFQIKIAKLQK